MLTKTQHLILSLLGATALTLVAANAWLSFNNRGNQAELQQRQQYLQQTAQLDVLYRDIAKALGELALKGSDRQVLDMLAAQGITVSAAAPAAPIPSVTPAAAAVQKR